MPGLSDSPPGSGDDDLHGAPGCGACRIAGRKVATLDPPQPIQDGDDRPPIYGRRCPACGHVVHLPAPREAEAC